MRHLLPLAFLTAILGCSSSDETSTGGDGSTFDVASDTNVGDTPDSPIDTAGGPCGDKTCTAGQLCRRTFTTGGPCQPCGDAGSCPDGSHCSGSCCVVDKPTYTYGCVTLPTACSAEVTCIGGCGSALCTGGCPCESVGGSTVTCHCLAP